MHDRVLLEPIRKPAVGAKHVFPLYELLRIGQLTEKEQVRSLFIAVTVFALVGLDDILYIYAAIEKLTGDCLLFTF